MFGSRIVTDCFNEVLLLQLGLEHQISPRKGERSTEWNTMAIFLCDFVKKECPLF